MKSNIIHAVNSAIRAGEAILEIYNMESSQWEVVTKRDDTPVTKADLVSNQIIMESLAHTKIAIISEEIAPPEKKEFEKLKEYWIIDPLDGTKEFLDKTGEFTVNIALIRSCRAVAGVIQVPCQNRLYFAIEGEGAYVVETTNAQIFENWDDLLAASKKLPLVQQRDNFIIAKSVSFTDKATNSYIEQLSKTHANSKQVAIGSSLKFAKVAEGSVDCYPRLSKIKQWDVAAGMAIALAAGAEVIDLNSNAPYLFDNWDLWTKEFVCRLKE